MDFQKQAADKLQKMDSFETLTQQVQINTDRLGIHGREINAQADSINTVIQSIEGLQLSNEQ